MPDPIQLAPMIAVYEDEGEFTLRVSDSPLAKIVSPQVIKAIGESTCARKLTLITATDTKVFKFGIGKPSVSASEQKQIEKPRTRVIQDASAPPDASLVEYEAEVSEAQSVEREMQRLNSQVVEMPVEAEEEPQTVVKRKRTPRPQSIPSTCGRCAGTGQTEAGGTCPVCRGEGSVSHYGRQR